MREGHVIAGFISLFSKLVVKMNKISMKLFDLHNISHSFIMYLYTNNTKIKPIK